ncbi:LysE family translocator [Desulfosporosinus nitroreducens]|uniref:LysE family translocator n=1 Tax=Desulfosporosinus nitroreducens TaxID=2018668 RepID=A0ABT8QU58_9FIRM|nr:LysE family transporter [Desulfosporosinus nitroreducens]MCO1602535.1 LysE family translocator [Desulfosporosinus nitroreducens]MDO0824130.1 LysE family translocator [Desulfosporosinus nitroreducens]
MDFDFLIKGIIIGFSIAAPVGPIGVLCIRRTLTEGRLSGFLSGLGAATADATYGMIAGFGLASISNFLIGQQIWLRIIGGLFLLYLGIKMFITKPSDEAVSSKRHGLIGSYISTFFLTIVNPMTIISFAAVFAGLGIGTIQTDYFSSLILVMGVFVGSGLWWLTLSSTVHVLGKRFDTKRLRWINKVSGIIILIFGFIALASS